MDKKPKILIIEDDKDGRELLGIILQNEYDLAFAVTGEEGLEKVKTFCPDLILLDIGLPGINGFEVIGDLKKNNGTKEISVIFITGFGDSENEALGFKAGAVDYIYKPFYSEPVKARIKICLDSQRAKQRIEALTGFLPICAYCKNIRDLSGKWYQIESFIHSHTGINFSHGICPECYKKLDLD